MRSSTDPQTSGSTGGIPAESGYGPEFTTEWTIPEQRSPIPGPSALLQLAHTTVEAARDHDPDRVEADALELFEAMTDHVLAQRVAVRELPAGDARLLRHGQQQIEDLLLDLAASAEEKVDVCDCERLADQVAAQLALQAADERRYLGSARA